MGTRGVTILIAEDDDGHAELIVRNLSRAGLRNKTLRFRNGREVLDYLFGRTDDGDLPPIGAMLLILDIRMPEIDGIEVLRQIKESKRLRPMPVIMVTSVYDPADIQRCQDLGCNSYIAKPVEYEKFVEAVTTLGLFLDVVEVPCLCASDGPQ